jgi:hypothetical protein
MLLDSAVLPQPLPPPFVMQLRLHARWLTTCAAPCFLQADIALLPFFERFQLALGLFQDYDLAGVHSGAIAQWMVSKGHV